MSLVFEVLDAGIEERGGERGDHAAEKGLPGQGDAPVGGDFLEGEQEAADGGAKGRSDPGRGAGADEVSSVFRVAETREEGELDPERLGLELRDAGADQTSDVDHRALGAAGHSCANVERTGQEFDHQGLDTEDVTDDGAVEEGDELRHSGSGSARAKNDDQGRADEHGRHAGGDAHVPGEEQPVCVKKRVDVFPLEVIDQSDAVMQQEPDASGHKTDESHHHPTVPVHPVGLVASPLPVDFAVRRIVVERLITSQDFQFPFVVVVVGVGRLEHRSRLLDRSRGEHAGQRRLGRRQRGHLRLCCALAFRPIPSHVAFENSKQVAKTRGKKPV